jgi:O-antigen/teichoic acid export membrane protein
MSVLKKLVSDTALYGLSTMVGRLLNYLLVPLHTSFFLPADLAIQVQLYAYAGFAFVLYTFGMETAFFRYARNEKDRQQYYNLILSAVILVSLVFSGTLLTFSNQIAAFIQYPENGNLVRMFAIIMATDAIASIPFAKLRLENKAKKFVAIRITNILITIALNIFFLVFCGDIYQGAYLSSFKPIVDLIYDPLHAPDYIILANLIANLSFLFFLRKELANFKFVLNKELFKPVWVYAFPILIMNAAALINSLFDRAFLQFLLPDQFYPNRTTKDAIGIYGQCFKLSIFMNLAIQAFKYAAEPFFFSNAEDKNAPVLFAMVMKWFIIICVTMWVGISLNVDLLAEIFLKKKIFHEGIAVVPWLLAGFLFLGIYYNLATWFKLSDKTQYGTYITIAGAAVVIVLNLSLVPKIGYLGCAIAFACSCFTMAALCYYFGQIHYPIPYNVPSALGYISTGATLIYLSSLVPVPNLWIAVPVHIFIFLVFLGIALWIERESLPFLKRKSA